MAAVASPSPAPSMAPETHPDFNVPSFTVTPPEMSLMKASDVNKSVTSQSRPQEAPEAANPPSASTDPRKPSHGSFKGIRVPVIDSVDLGLRVLYAPQEMDDTSLDIIAVHGIGVDPKTTWHHPVSRTNWLGHESMLQKDLPNARIMTFNYDSVWFGDKPTRLTIDSVATNLLDQLQMERSDCPDRPILFIAHCFGGLVVQRAFTMATTRAHDYLRLADCMRGIIFLGTPHHGISGSAQSATREKIYTAIMQAQLRIEDSIQRSMVQDDATLLNVVDDFTRLVATKKPQPVVFCFYETKPTSIGLIANLRDMEPEFMVNESSGTLNGHRKADLPLDHFSMNKFPSRECNHYKRIAYVIKGMAKEADSMAIVDPATPVATRSSNPFKRERIPTFFAPIAKEKNLALRGNLLAKLDEAFHRVERVVLLGESGFGKTHIAVEYAYKYHEEHKGAGIFWINATSPEQFEFSCHLIDESLSQGSTENKDNAMMLDTVRHHLERVSKRALLIVLDGLEDEESLVATHDPKLSLLSLLPKGNQARILATTRSKSLARRWSGTKSESVIPVSRLSVDDTSVILFGTRIQGGRLSWAKTVGETLRFSAGEISMALQYKSLLKREFNNQAKAYLGMIGASSRPMTADPGPRCPAPSWKPLHQRIEAESPRLMDLMEMICVMDVQCVPSILFNRAERSKGIPQLIRYGLIEPSADDRIFTITAMIRGCIRTSFSHPQGGKDAEVAAQESSLARVGELFKTEPRELLPCALSVLQFKLISSSAKSHLVSLQQDVSEHMGGMKQYTRAILLLEASLQLLQKSIPNSEKKQAEVRSSLDRLKSLAQGGADVLPQTKDVSLARRGARVSDVSKEYLYSEDDAHARRAYDTAVLQLVQATPSSDVIALSRELSSWSGKKYGDSSVRSAKHQFNLGLAYAARGQYPEAETEFRLTLKRMAAAAQQPPRGEVDNRRDAEQMQYRVHAELARLYCEQQRFKDAEAAFQNSLPGQWELLGHYHADTLATRHNHAAFLQEQGDLDGALQELRALLRDQFVVLGASSPEVLRTACTIALNSSLAGRLTDAEKQFKAVLTAQRNLLGDNHYETVRTGKMLSEVQEDMKLVD